MFLPGQVHVERSIEIKCAPEAVFPLVNNLKNWDQWSPWHKKDSMMVKTYGATYEGKGATYSWQSNHKDVGNGHIDFTEVIPNQYIKLNMYFMDSGEPAFSEYKFEKTPTGTKIIWSMDADMSSPFAIGKYFGLMMDKMVGPDFEKGLNALKKIGESSPAEIVGRVDTIEEVNVAAINMMQTEGECDVKDIGTNLGMMFGKIMEQMASNKAEMTGAPSAMYPGFKEGDTHAKIIAFVPCSKQCNKCDAGFKCSQRAATKAVVAHYYGPYEKTGKAYEKLLAWIAENKKEIAGEPWEEYANDPMEVKDPAKYLTNIYFPIK